MTSVVEVGSRVEARRAWLLFGLFAAVFLLFYEGAISGSDGSSMYRVTTAMVDRRAFDVPKVLGSPGVDGLYYSIYGFGVPLLGVPLYLLSKVPAAVLGHDDFMGAFFVALIMPLVVAGIAPVTFYLARRFGVGVRMATVAAIAAVAGNFTLVYSKEFFSEPLGALCIAIAAERLMARRPALAGAAIGMAALARPQYFVVAAILLVVVLWRDRWRAAFVASLGIGAAGLISIGYNLARFGSWHDFGYGAGGFSTPLWTGLRGTLFSLEKSVLLFMPVALLGPLAARLLWRRDRYAATFVGATTLCVSVMAITWVEWRAGWSWGPRFLIGVVPLLVVAAAAWAENNQNRIRLFAGLAVIGALVSLPVLVVSSRAQQLDDPIPRFGPAPQRQWALVGPTVRHTLENPFEYQAAEGDNYRYVSTWQFGVSRVMGRGGLALAAVVSAALVAVAVAFGMRLRS